MDLEWIKEDEHFDALSQIIEETERGGVEIRDELPRDKINLYEEGVNQGLFKKDELFDCPNCGRTYSIEYSGDECDCGYPLDQEVVSEDVHTTQYYHDIYPEFIKDRIGTNIGAFEIVYRNDRIDEIPAAELHPVNSSSSNYLHISPYFHSEVGLMPFPGYSDVFISWSKIRELLLEPNETADQLASYLDGDSGNEDRGGDILLGDGGTKFNSGLSAPNLQNLTDAPWYTMQSDTSPEVANRRSQDEFGEEYYNVFENLGMEFLHVMFPHAIQLEGGKQGKPEPDGYLHILKEGRKQTYLVESKCYSRDFKIFSESDKNRRYINKFISDIEPETDYNLVGCIYIATRFDDKRTKKDIDDAVSRSVGERNIDIICINDCMMREAVESLRDLYRQEPSSKYRIYEQSTFYSDLLQGLNKTTEQNGVDLQAFKQQILELMEKAGRTETTRESTLRTGFERSEGYESFRERVGG